MTDRDQEIAAAFEDYRRGRLAPAGVRCEKILAAAPEHPGALQVLAAVRLAEGRIDAAVGLARRAAAAAPGSPNNHNNLGAMLLRLGRHAEALAAFDAALALKADFAEAHNNRGHALNALGRPQEALPCLDRALKLKPGYAAALGNRADALRALGRRDEASAAYAAAVGAYDRAVAANPGDAELHFRRASALSALERRDEALAGYDRALALKPDHDGALLGRGEHWLGRREPERALPFLDKAVAAAPGNAAAHCARGNALYALNRFPEAVAAFEKALALEPGYVAAIGDLGTAYADQGERGKALDCYRRALALDPNSARTRWKLAMHAIPILPDSDAEIAPSRADFARELAALESALPPGAGADEVLVGTVQPYYLAYQEEDNRGLLARYGALCARLMEDWRRAQRISAPAARRAGPVRLGIVSAQFLQHSVWSAIVKGWVRHLDRSRFELHGFHLSPRFDVETAWAGANTASFTAGVRTLRQWADAIAVAAPDVLIYPEIGMDPMAVKLASLRLAPVQAAAWGHPETTGLPTIDYYLSAEGMEPPGAEANYTEKLVALPRLGCCYAARPFSGGDVDLRALGVAADAPLLLCPGTPFKYAPRHDRVFSEIARRLGRCRFLFFVDPKRRALSDKLRRRLAARFAADGLKLEDYAAFVPWMKPKEFYALMAQAHAFLDTIGFSGFNTAAQAVECGLPVVAWEGRFLRGRLASGILRRMGLDDLVVRDEGGYVDLTVRLAADAGYREEMRGRIAASRGVLFDDVETVRALEEFLLRAVGRS
jgi:predicted O-linked N-acetylglucosamine transferase (SPINDLY family)